MTVPVIANLVPSSSGLAVFACTVVAMAVSCGRPQMRRARALVVAAMLAVSLVAAAPQQPEPNLPVPSICNQYTPSDWQWYANGCFWY